MFCPSCTCLHLLTAATRSPTMPILVPTSPRDATSRAPGPDFSSKPHSAAEAFFASPELVEHLFDELDHESHRVLAYMRMQFLDAFARRRYRKIDLMMMEKLLKVADTVSAPLLSLNIEITLKRSDQEAAVSVRGARARSYELVSSQQDTSEPDQARDPTYGGSESTGRPNL